MQKLENGDHKASLGACLKKKNVKPGTLAILAMCEAEIGRSWFETSPTQIIHRIPPPK
jgi:hypothetical protein